MLLLDNSAWARLERSAPRPSTERRREIAEWMAGGRIAVCLPFLLEAGYSARSGNAHRVLLADLALLPRVVISERIEALALDAQSALARVGHHRLAPADLIIAACAHDVQGGVLHYDRDYDLIGEHSALEFESDWLAPAGTLD